MVRARYNGSRLRDLMGTRFVNGGRSVTKGMDCWGLVMEVCKRYGVVVPDFTVDAFAYMDIDALAEETTKLQSWEEVYKPQSTDAPLVVLMRMHSHLITHAGVYLGNNKVIHTMANMGVIVSRVDALKSRIAGYYRSCSR